MISNFSKPVKIINQLNLIMHIMYLTDPVRWCLLLIIYLIYAPLHGEGID